MVLVVVMKGTDLSKANLKEAQFSKGFLQGTVHEVVCQYSLNFLDG